MNGKHIQTLGQVFTPVEIIKEIISLKKNLGSILEPSCGDGAFLPYLSKENLTAIEIDSEVCPNIALNQDFFSFQPIEKFDTIIGNPPYVKYKNINSDTKEYIKKEIESGFFEERSNLYLFFIKRCIELLKDNGELIFIVPRDFIKASSSYHLNEFIYSQGTITHWKDLGDKIIFEGFSPNCVIFRFEKNNFSRKTISQGQELDFKVINGQILFTKEEYPLLFSDLFFVKVGATSGFDKIFEHPKGNGEFVYSKTKDTGLTKKMFYNIAAPELEQQKPLLLSRKIRNFNEKNWYHWGRNCFISEQERIYVNVKTRKKDPFFLHSCKLYDGSVLGIFPKINADATILQNLCEDLNKVNWSDLGFICDGRFMFTQSSLEKTALPALFEKYTMYTSKITSL